MARTLSTAFKNALDDDVVVPRFFVELELSSSTVRYWTGSHDITWNSQTWSGNGYLSGIGQVTNTRRIEGDGLQIEIAGELSALISLAMSSVEQNKDATIYFALLDSSENIIADPVEYFKGVFDFATIEDDPDEAIITLNFANLLIEDDEENELRYNHQTQQALFSGDDGFEYIEALEDFRGYWGKKNDNPLRRPGQGGGGGKGIGKGAGGRRNRRKRRKNKGRARRRRRS